MTTQKGMSLPGVLSELAKRLPERIRGTGGYKWSTFYASSSVFDTEAVWSAYDDQIDANPLRLHLLEFALREECDVRGWHWQVSCGRAEVGDWDRRRAATSIHDIPGATPAHLLALALLEWLKILDVLNGTREARE